MLRRGISSNSNTAKYYDINEELFISLSQATSLRLAVNELDFFEQTPRSAQRFVWYKFEVRLRIGKLEKTSSWSGLMKEILLENLFIRSRYELSREKGASYKLSNPFILPTPSL